MADLDAVMATLDQAGVCHAIHERWKRLGPNEPDQRQELLAASYRVLEESPTPVGEWPGLREVCGDELLGQILSISHASLRLHWLALVVEALEGSYNAIGIRRWFAHPRQALDGSAPLALLEGPWLPEQAGPQRLKALAEGVKTGIVAS